MLAFFESHLGSIRKARSDGDIAEVLQEIAAALGFRSGYVIEYTADLRAAKHIIDSHRERSQWWQEYFRSPNRAAPSRVAEILNRGGVQVFGAERYAGMEASIVASARKLDMIEAVIVPVSFDGTLVGIAGFAGTVELSAAQQTALELVVYALFAQLRSFASTGIFVPHEALTPREKEVIALSAEGLTSVEIAERLGMAARTVNQHVDNVADKLGTKNRTHTIAEVIRHGLLH